uniref:Uncharacterized protein n=1 Tax=Anguilla anguilla TaxID=7936 RepID=A0A0E9RP69_ANGAN
MSFTVYEEWKISFCKCSNSVSYASMHGKQIDFQIDF